MLSISRSKFFSRYLPMLLSVIFLAVGIFSYLTIHQTTKTAEASWYSNSWTYRKQLSIDHTKVSTVNSTTLANFPVLFSRTDTDLRTVANGGGVASSTGADILFTSSDGSTKLSHEIETYSSTTGQTIIWVKIPSLSPSVDTVIYIYYGNAAAADQQDTANVWDANYRGVYHLKDGTTISTKDSTSNALNGTNNSVTATTGQIDGGGNFSSAYVSVGDTGITTNFTIEAWINVPSVSQFPGVWTTNDNGGNNAYRIEEDNNALYVYNGSTLTNFTNIVTNTWMHIVVTLDITNVKTYTNGAFSNSNPAVTTTTNNFAFGRGWNNLRFFPGLMDEVRVSNIARSADWVATEYNNQKSPLTFFSTVSFQVQNRLGTGVALTNHGSGVAKYNASWPYRKQIIIQHNKVSGTVDLINFPILFSTTNSDFKSTANGGLVASSTGVDILFTDSDGTTKLSHELERYTPTTGEIIAWVKIPTLSVNSDTVIYIYYGNAAAADQQDTANVWDSNYKGVWHLSDGVRLTAKDSTSNGNNGVITNATATTGQIDGGGSFNGTNTNINMGDQSAHNVMNITLSAWVKATSYPNVINVISGKVQATAPYFGYELRVDGGSLDFNIAIGSTTYAVATTQPSTGVFHYVIGTFDGNTMRLYVDGIQTNTTAVSGSMATAAGNLLIGETNVFSGRMWNGVIDDVRISGSARSADWIATEYNNQNSPSTFYVFGNVATQMKARGGVKFH